MKLDPRIIKGKRPLTCFDTEEAKNFIGKQCYFTNDITSFEGLDSRLNKGKLTSVGDDGIYPYKHIGTIMVYATNFILPCEWVQEKKKYKWRAFKDHAEYKECLNDGIIESWIKIKEKNSDEIFELMYVGGGGDKIILGGQMFTVSRLFNDSELFNESADEWQPFGVYAED